MLLYMCEKLKKFLVVLVLSTSHFVTLLLADFRP